MSFELGQSKNQHIGPNVGALGPAVENLTDAAQRTIPSWAGYGPFIGGVGRRPQRFAGAQPLSDDVGIATASPPHDAARLITGETLYVDGGPRIIDEHFHHSTKE